MSEPELATCLLLGVTPNPTHVNLALKLLFSKQQLALFQNSHPRIVLQQLFVSSNIFEALILMFMCESVAHTASAWRAPILQIDDILTDALVASVILQLLLDEAKGNVADLQAIIEVLLLSIKQ